MSKLAGYSEDDKNLVKVFLQDFLFAKVARKELSEKDDDAIKVEMPKAFDAAKIYVDTVNRELGRYANIDPTDQVRIRNLSAQMFQGSIHKNEINHDMTAQEVESLSVKLIRGSVQTMNAVAEYLCG